MSTDEKVNILLVDDQPAKLLSYEAILGDLGENLIKASSGREALECLLKTNVAVVLVDVCMPELDGFELAALIRQHPRCQKTAIIFVSGVHLTDLDRLKGYELGAVDYVPVPVVPELLRAKVSVFADLYRKTQQLEELNRKLEQRVAERTAELEVDITERKRTEAALRDAHELLADRAKLLEALVEKRTAKLQETVGDLEAFSYSIVHDLRAPLRAMQSFAQLLAAECGDVSPAGKDYIQRITTAAERMDRLIQEVLNYSQVVRTPLPLEPVDVHELLRGIVETYPAFQPPRALVELEGDFPSVSANVAALTQCVSNLLGNAAKFVAPGVTPSVRVWAETHPSPPLSPLGGKTEKEVRGEGLSAPAGVPLAPDSVSDERQRVRIFFQDNGIGIEKNAHEIIFQMFQRLSNRYEGTGIGLAIVKKAVERMHGRVGLESEPGQGSTFWLELNGAPNGEPQTPAGRAVNS